MTQQPVQLTPETVKNSIAEAQGNVAPEDYYRDIAHLAADLLRQLRPNLRGDNREMVDLILKEVK